MHAVSVNAIAGAPDLPRTFGRYTLFELIGKGQEIRAIAKMLHLSPKTVETHRAHIKEKLNLENARQVARLAVQWVNQRDG